MYVLLREPFLNIPGLAYAVAIDLAIVVLVALNVLRGGKIGFLRQLIGFGGFLAGMFLGVLLVPFLVGASQDRLLRTVLTLFSVVGIGLFVGWSAELIGKELRYLNWRYPGQTIDNILGAVTSGVISLGLVWLISSMFLGSSLAPLATGLQRSFIIRALSAVLPTAPTILTHVETIIDPNSAPQVFVGLEPWPVTPLDGAMQADVSNAISSAGGSTVQIEAFGCGGLFGASGFVVGPSEVITNAHVIAGIKHPIVLDGNGAHATAVILFDASNDVAILRVDRLSGRPLLLATGAVRRGVRVTVLGFPDSGPFAALPGAILAKAPISGRDIYSRDEVTRDIYTVQADIRPGSSGSPIVLTDGSVAGMIYGRSMLADGIGYAISSTQILPLVHGLGPSSSTVSTGACTSE